MSSKRVLVTGSAGTLGRSAVHELRRWHEVQGFDRVPSPDLKDAFVGNLTDAEAVEETCAWQDSGAVRRWNHPADYPWSSYRMYLGLGKSPPWLDMTRTLRLFGGQGRRQQVVRSIGTPGVCGSGNAAGPVAGFDVRSCSGYAELCEGGAASMVGSEG